MDNHSEQTAQHYAKRTLVLFFLANLMNFYDRQIVSALAEAIKAEFSLTDVQVGGLSSAFEFTYPLAAVLLAVVADRWSRRRLIALAVALWSSATALTGAVGSYLALVMMRLSAGVGQGGYGPSAVATLNRLFPHTHRGRAVAVHELGLMLGSAAGYLLGGLLAQLAGWRVSFLVAGLPGLLLAWFIWRLCGVASTDAPVSGISPRIAVTALRQVFVVPTLRILYLSGVFIYLATSGLIFWLPSFMQRFHGYSMASAAALGGAAPVVIGVIGVLVGGWAGDQLTQRHPGGRMVAIGLGLLAATPLTLIAILTPNRWIFLLNAALALFFYAFIFPCTAPQIHDVTPPTAQVTAQAVMLFITHYLGSLPSAPIIGWLAGEGGDLRAGMSFMPILGLLAAFLMLWGSRFARQDAAAQHRV